MAGTVCGQCGEVIAVVDINVPDSVAVCRKCGKLWQLSDLAEDVAATDAPRGREEEVVPDTGPERMPRGCWMRSSGTEVVLGARCLSGSTIHFAILTTAWNSLAWIFFTEAFVGFYSYVTGAPPRWLHGIGQSTSSSGTPSGMFALFFVFLIPFLLVGAVSAGVAVVGILGKFELTVKGRDAVAFTGIGTIGWKHRFAADLVRAVRIDDASFKFNNLPIRVIVIEADDRIRIGALISDTRRHWLAETLRKLLMKGN